MNLSITYLQEAYRDSRLTPAMLVEDILQQCQQYTEHNIWISLLSKKEIQPYIDRLEQHTPESLPLYGIPFAIKDNIDLAGVATTAACADYRYIPQQSAFVVQQLIDAGAIPIGKTNMDQFATGLVGTRSPEPWGACRNAFNQDYISGGSSSGSAVAVALGLVSFSLGTDTAGSGRVPAAFNNLVGLKPSKGLLSTRGVIPACRSLDCVSIFALTTDDANNVFEQAAVFDSQDAFSRKNSFANNNRHYGLKNASFRFAVPETNQLEFFGNTEAADLFKQSCERFIALGGEPVSVDFAPFLNAARLLYEGPWVAERYVAIEELISTRPDTLLPVIRTIIGGAKDKLATDAFKALYQLQEYKRQCDEQLAQVDFLLTPTAGTIYTIDEVNADPIKRNSNLGYYTNYMNLLDYSAVALPAGFMSNGLPFGISLVAAALKDRALLSFGRQWQQDLDLNLGKTDNKLVALELNHIQANPDMIDVVVCGAHLKGLPLNWQLTERGADFVAATTTAAAYRLYDLGGDGVKRPGLLRDEGSGSQIQVEVWRLSADEFGSFVAGVPAPLGIGKVELANGQWLTGFICEPYGLADAIEITEFGGWVNYMNT